MNGSARLRGLGAAAFLAVTLQPSAGYCRASSASIRVAPHQERRNRALVLRFCEAVYNERNYRIATELLAKDFIQHNPKIPTGRRAFIESYSGVIAHHPGLHSQIIRSVASGDLVWTHVRVTDASGAYQMALVNIFRIARGRIVEHWDVLQAVPNVAANSSTMF